MPQERALISKRTRKISLDPFPQDLPISSNAVVSKKLSKSFFLISSIYCLEASTQKIDGARFCRVTFILIEPQLNKGGIHFTVLGFPQTIGCRHAHHSKGHIPNALSIGSKIITFKHAHRRLSRQKFHFLTNSFQCLLRL